MMGLDFVSFGEVLMRLTAPANQRFSQASAFSIHYGGGEANVAIGLSYMGFKAAHITALPKNDIGEAMLANLKSTGLHTDFIQLEGERVGIYFMERGSSVRASKIVYDRAHSAFATIKKGAFNWEEILKNTRWFHFTGISPAISQGVCEELLAALRVCKALNIRVSADVNYRKNLWQYGKSPQEVMPELLAYCHYLFASRADLLDVFPSDVFKDVDTDSFSAACAAVMASCSSLKAVVNSKRRSVSADHNFISAKCFNGVDTLKVEPIELLPIVDRIGGGDAFCAGVIASLLDFPDDLLRALQCGLASSALKHTIEGDYSRATKAEVLGLMAGDSSGRLVR